MDHTTFEQHARGIVENYWRIRAALALFRQSTPRYMGQMRYEGVPQLGRIIGLLPAENVEDALDALLEYAANRLARDFFTALIASFEARLIAYLSATGASPSGTLGALQVAVQAIATIPADQVSDVDEVRERRNMLMHHDGAAQTRYITAAQKVTARAGVYVSVPNVGDMVIPTGEYLTYAANVLVAYSASL